MRVILYLSRFALGLAVVIGVAMALSQDALRHNAQTHLHRNWDGLPLPGNSAAGHLLLFVLIGVVTLSAGYSLRVPLWCPAACLLVGGSLANLLAMQVWQGIPDFIPVGRVFFSPGDVSVTAGLVVLMLGMVLAKDEPEDSPAPRLRRRQRRAQARCGSGSDTAC